jgi:uncharacterized membrane protein
VRQQPDWQGQPAKTERSCHDCGSAAITALDIRESLRSVSSNAGESTSAAPDSLVTSSVIVAKSRQECYEFWRNPSNMTRISPMVESVTVLDDHTSRWLVKTPTGYLH